MIVQLVGLDLLAAVVGIELWTGQVKSLFLVGCMRLVCLAGGGGTSLICVHVCSFVLLCCLGRIRCTDWVPPCPGCGFCKAALPRWLRACA